MVSKKRTKQCILRPLNTTWTRISSVAKFEGKKSVSWKVQHPFQLYRATGKILRVNAMQLNFLHQVS